MSKTDYDIRSVSLKFIDALLRLLIKCYLRLIIVEFIPLHGLRVAFRHGLRSVHPEKAYPDAAGFDDRSIIKDVLTVRLSKNISTYDLETGILQNIQHIFCSVVKFMITDRGDIISRLVHHPDCRLALVEIHIRTALHIVAAVSHDHMSSAFFELISEPCNICIAHYVSVNIVGLQYDRFARVIISQRIRLHRLFSNCICRSTHHHS